jgi:rfaE bifunctional protein kinase chain/domain
LSREEKKVFISGNFNVLHAGHIRLFAFGRQLGDTLIVGVTSDAMGGSSVHVNEEARLEAVQSNSWVSQAILLDEPIEETIARVKPDIVVKGKEFEYEANAEDAALRKYGGRLVFGLSEVSLSSLKLLSTDLALINEDSIKLPKAYLARYGLSAEMLGGVVERFSDLKVCVVGDLIIDEYVTCEALGMSQEDPTLVVTPTDYRRFLGGAGIVAAHAAELGAKATLITVIGNDEAGDFAKGMLSKYGVAGAEVIDETRPTTLKQRFRADKKTLLRVSHLHQHSVSPAIQDELFTRVYSNLADADLIVFSDFNYGCLPQKLVDKCIKRASDLRVVMAADSQCSSQVGDVSRFAGMSLVSATEREARISLRDNDDGLSYLAEALRCNAEADSVLLKLGADGVLLHTKNIAGFTSTNQLPALNSNPMDVAGAGDSMLITTALALGAGSPFWAAAAIGTVASALQVSRMGNQPLKRKEFLRVIKNS